MSFKIKLILSHIIVVLIVIVFSFIFSDIYVRQNFVRIIIGMGPNIEVMLTPQGIRFLETVRQTLLISGLISIGIGALLAFLLSSFALRPLKEMQKFVRKISKGEFEERVHIKSNDEIGELASSLNYMAARLTDIENMRKTLVQNVSHDLRTPVASIKGYMELIEDESFTKEEKERAIEVIKDEIERMERMLRDISKLSAIDSKNFTLHTDKIELNTLIKNSVDLLRMEAEKKGLQLKLELSQGNIFIEGDSKRITEVMGNLITNAIKFTDQGRITIKTLTGKSEAKIIVEDTGIGIDKKDLPHIFERFYKGDTSRSSDGTGIGLAIVKELIHAHKGTVEVESEKGRGSRFTITLPVVS